jgi:hypothetical protein
MYMTKNNYDHLLLHLTGKDLSIPSIKISGYKLKQIMDNTIILALIGFYLHYAAIIGETFCSGSIQRDFILLI